MTRKCLTSLSMLAAPSDLPPTYVWCWWFFLNDSLYRTLDFVWRIDAEELQVSTVFWHLMGLKAMPPACFLDLLKCTEIPVAMWSAGGTLPSITIEYRDMQIEADALVGTASVPSLTQSFWGFIKVRSHSPC